jgi:excisionase family DNA binding protein
MKTSINTDKILGRILERLETIIPLNREWFTPEQVAVYLGLSIHTVYQYVSKRNIPFHKIPNSTKLLFKKSEIDEWIEGKIRKCNSSPKGIADEIWESVN